MLWVLGYAEMLAMTRERLQASPPVVHKAERTPSRIEQAFAHFRESRGRKEAPRVVESSLPDMTVIGPLAGRELRTWVYGEHDHRGDISHD